MKLWRTHDRDRVPPRLTSADAHLAGSAAGLGTGRLFLHGGRQAAHLIGNANQEHGLARVLQQVDDAVGRLFQINRLAVGQKVDLGFRRGTAT